MKYSIRILSIIGLLMISQLVHSDSITDTYSTGDTLTATKMNNIKSAVNDNDARIAALETMPKANVAATAPTPFDDINAGFPEGSVWVDMTDKVAYILVDSAPNQAVWKLITAEPILYSIGDVGPAGGIVFYVTEGGLHGLEVAPAEGTAEWGCSGTPISGADDIAIGTGAQNTTDILASCVEPGTAAAKVDAYTLNGYDDWFLPSKDELNELYLNRDIIGGYADDRYWSSTEAADNLALFQFFGNGIQFLSIKDDVLGVRAVRDF